MGNGGDKRFREKVRALQLNTAGLLKLLGGTEDEQQRFWERVRGITKPSVMRLVDNQVDVLQGLVTQVHTSVKALEKAAKQIATEQQADSK
jgi:hypothetical protein